MTTLSPSAAPAQPTFPDELGRRFANTLHELKAAIRFATTEGDEDLPPCGDREIEACGNVVTIARRLVAIEDALKLFSHHGRLRFHHESFDMPESQQLPGGTSTYRRES
jgi:hypothetical protein